MNLRRAALTALVLATACTEKTRAPERKVEALWTATAPMPSTRANHVAVLLPGGTVFVAGGGPSSTHRYSPATDSWSSLAHGALDRSFSAAVLLPNGKVLIVGGVSTLFFPIGPAELYDPATDQWSPAGTIVSNRTLTTATLLPSGKVLVTGGPNSAAVDLYDPVTNAWTSAAPLPAIRRGHTATLLPSGKVLVAGGHLGSGTAAAATTLLYDPATDAWQPAASMAAGRAQHTATLLTNGSVLVAGGNNGTSLASAELYDPATNAWSPAGTLSGPRQDHRDTLLPDGRVLLTGGGSTAAGGAGISSFRSVELYSPATHTWSLGGPMLGARNGNTATLLPDGRVLVVGGGTPGAELYDPALGITCTTAADCSASQPHCIGGLCCTSPCDGGCEACDLPGHVGTCTSVAKGEPGIPACTPYVCSGAAGGCPTLCADDSFCAATHYCDFFSCAPNGSGSLGSRCRTDIQCASGHCEDGICCASACTDACARCNQTFTSCVPANPGTVDVACNGYRCGVPDAGCRADCAANADCAPTHRCVDAGCIPLLPAGSACALDTDCADGSCHAGLCCSTSCPWSCATCDGPAFTCAVAPPGFDGGPACGPYACNGVDVACPTECVSDAGCLPGNYCTAALTCLPDGTGTLGAGCASKSDCATGLCVDGVCCDAICGRGDPSDCQACSIDAGAKANGTCGPLAAGRLCRVPPGDAGAMVLCDVPERCNGTALTCPPNQFADAGVICRTAAGPCDVVENCTGASPFCPSDQRRSAGFVCRQAAGPCDVPETCTGTSPSCPADLLRAAGFECRSAIGACDVLERCAGDAGDCPPDRRAADGMACGSTLVCTGGVCTSRTGGGAGGSGGGAAQDAGLGGGMGGTGGGAGGATPRGCGCSTVPYPFVLLALVFRFRLRRTTARIRATSSSSSNGLTRNRLPVTRGSSRTQTRSGVIPPSISNDVPTARYRTTSRADSAITPLPASAFARATTGSSFTRSSRKNVPC